MYLQTKSRNAGGKIIAPVNLNYLSDRELVDSYSNGNEDCLAVLVERHKRRLFLFILKRIKNPDLANDIFQETYFKVIRCLKGGLYNEEDKFLPWVMRIARNMIIDHFRRTSRIRMVSTVKNADG
ncbi:MAG TPA: sigma-70 family RNA polymerase sigma factor, partial [Bacteroidia bacterium]